MSAVKTMPPEHGHSLPKLLIATLAPVGTALVVSPLLPLFNESMPSPTFPALQASLGFALLAFVAAVAVVPAVGEAFIQRGLKGRDLLKPGGRVSGPTLPECMGLPLACIYILLMMLFIPFPFSHIFSSHDENVGREHFPAGELNLYLSSLLSLFTATLLGFIDDLFDIRWRHKLPIPLIAAIPTLLVYYSDSGVTSVVLPRGVIGWIRWTGLGRWIEGRVVDLGPLYYVYLLLLPTFTTNSINILAGCNGVEAIQAFIIALSVLLNDLLFLPLWPDWVLSAAGVGVPEQGKLLWFAGEEMIKRHLMSTYFMLPLVGLCAGFLWHNWYPARAFPGDTFCYFTGMAFSAVALQGHFTKTLVLFFLPQIFNFILSCPQLFGLVECPRHRLPRYDAKTDLLHPSQVLFARPPPLRTKVILRILEVIGLVELERGPPGIIASSNLTILNVILVRFGPMREQTLCLILGGAQVTGSAIAFWVRYGLGAWIYGGDRR